MQHMLTSDVTRITQGWVCMHMQRTMLVDCWCRWNKSFTDMEHWMANSIYDDRRQKTFRSTVKLMMTNCCIGAGSSI